MTLRHAVDTITAGIAAIDANLLGDDSPLENPWEEIKEQLQNGLLPEWPAYLVTIQQFTTGLVRNLQQPDLEELMLALKCSSPEAAERKLVNQVIARGKKEKIRYAPFDFEFLCYRLLNFVVYGQVIERTGLDKCHILAYSGAAQTGEYGTVDTSRIEHILSREQFEEARARSWPDVLPAHWTL